MALLSKPTDRLLAGWQSGDVAGPIAPDAPNKLRQTMAIAEAAGWKRRLPSHATCPRTRPVSDSADAAREALIILRNAIIVAT